jgi:hypothetical protein
VLSHGHNLRDDRALSPFYSENFCELSQILSGSFSDREDSVPEPAHAQVAELFVEKLDTQLTSEKRDVLDDSKPNSPLFVFS